MFRQTPRAFSIVELVMVVAILSIMGIIAQPNFQDAVVRTKVSRTKVDLNTVAMGIETHQVDHGRPPYDGEPGYLHYGWVTSLSRLTTPIAYLSKLPPDPFQDAQLNLRTWPRQSYHLDPAQRLDHTFDYATAHWTGVHHNFYYALEWYASFGHSPWKLTSAGPDHSFVNAGSYYGFRMEYDPTNGTTSVGDILKVQR